MSTVPLTSPPPPKAEMAPTARGDRPTIVGPDSPEQPYPLELEGVVTKGFGRGARFLGIPTGTSLPSLTSNRPLADAYQPTCPIHH